MTEDDRKRILERRARFVAAALAGAGLAGAASGCESKSQVCLSISQVPMDAPDDTGKDAGEDAG